MIDLLETHVGLEFLADECVYRVNRDLALDVHLNLRLDIPIVDIRAFLYI